VDYALYVLLAFAATFATAFIGRAKGGSFLLWLIIGTILPFLGLVVALLYRSEHDEPERSCPRCGKAQKLYAQVCTRCGTELYLPDPSEVHHPGASATRS